VLESLVVGAGFAGAVCARQLAKKGHRVRVIDRRTHIGGNAFDEFDAHGVLVHRYGPHIFHTNSKRIFEFLSDFTNWRYYEHRVLASVQNQLLPIPINRTTLNRLYNLNLDESGVLDFLEKVRLPRNPLRNSEDVVLSSVGAELCDLFFSNYTLKQWGVPLRDLSAGVASRIPTRSGDDDRYFTDSFQFMPGEGYARMFERILDHPNIVLELGTDFESVDRKNFGLVIFSGPIDAYFNFCFGRLPYRSLRFDHQHLEVEQFQSVGTVNFPNQHEYTRITEFKHLTGQRVSGTSIVYEYPMSEGEPYYPIPRPENEVLFKRYQELAKKESDVIFVGRLAQYRYYNMDQVVGAALAATDSL
tara:strand:- start:272 stop:1348 length:1077 start_codon:yes stop_codon:yes gene_type:complete